MGTKAIFFDIDGTLWDEKFQIPESTKKAFEMLKNNGHLTFICLLYTSPSPRDRQKSRMPSSA